MNVFRWIGKNLWSFLLAFALALSVWVSAVIADDPNQECVSPSVIPLNVTGKDPSLILMSSLPDTISVKFLAPSSICNRLSIEEGAASAEIDLTDLSIGDHQVDVHPNVSVKPVRILEYSPQSLLISLEQRGVETFDIISVIEGDPALGFEASEPILDELQAEVSGPQSQVSDVFEVRAMLNISGARESITTSVPLQAFDQNGRPITGVILNPDSVQITQSIQQKGGYRDVAVTLVTEGQVAYGYRMTSIVSSPPVVTLFSADPQIVNDLPGFVETMPLDLTDATDDIVIRMPLNLPEEVTIVGVEQSVLVQVSIAAIESSLTLMIPVEAIGITPGLDALISPETVTVILSGPLSLLDELQVGDVRIFVDLTDLEIGMHQADLIIEILPDQIHEDLISPREVQVEVIIAPTPSVTPIPASTP